MLVPQSNDINNLYITHECKYCLLNVITVGDGWYWLMRQKDVQQNHQIYQNILWILLSSPSIRCAVCVCVEISCERNNYLWMLMSFCLHIVFVKIFGYPTGLGALIARNGKHLILKYV